MGVINLNKPEWLIVSKEELDEEISFVNHERTHRS